MSILQVNAKSKKYPIYIEKSFNKLKSAFENAGLGHKKILVITDTNVEKLYLDAVLNELKEISQSISHYAFKAGEENKNIETMQDLYKACMDNMLDRKSLIVALGGGVCGDMAGFAAATYMRGIKFVQIPTTLLAQVDSSVGGKTGIDFLGGKNIIGAFYQPEFVYVNVNTLKTLPKDEIISGMGEVIKHGLIKDVSYFEYICKNKEKIKVLEEDAMIHIVEGSCKIKSEVVSADEQERGIREILNFGHTFGHAVESVSNFSIPHGKAVGLGMICALDLSEKYGNIGSEEKERIKLLLDYFEMPLKIEDLDKNKIYSQMFYDKKIKDGKLTFIILKNIGTAIADNTINEDEIKKALDEI